VTTSILTPERISVARAVSMGKCIPYIGTWYQKNAQFPRGTIMTLALT
jgi:hypothetical protein